MIQPRPHTQKFLQLIDVHRSSDRLRSIIFDLHGCMLNGNERACSFSHLTFEPWYDREALDNKLERVQITT